MITWKWQVKKRKSRDWKRWKISQNDIRRDGKQQKNFKKWLRKKENETEKNSIRKKKKKINKKEIRRKIESWNK